MSSRLSLYVLVSVLVAVFAGEIALLSRNTRGEAYYSANDRVATAMVDDLAFFDTAEAFRTGTMEHVKLVEDAPAHLKLDAEPQKGYPRDGRWMTRIIETKFPFTELLPCWNLLTPKDTGVLFHVRVREAGTNDWSPWLRIGSWGRTNDKISRGTCKLGSVVEDTLRLDVPADAYQLRATLQSFDLQLDHSPLVRRISVTYSGPVSEQSIWAKAMHVNPGPADTWAKDLGVPFRAQGNNDFAITGMTCSPTSVSMVLQHFRVDRPTNENALAIWDDHNEMFGNWANAVQRASELGMNAWLQRFRNWDQVKALIAKGQPVIASIAFEGYSFSDSPVFDASHGTDGHLIVIRGFTPDGTVIVNDPASKDKGNRALYPARGLAHAWFGHGGVGYVIQPPPVPMPEKFVKVFPATLPTTAPVAETR